jgi:predicted Zn-dependent peptidase
MHLVRKELNALCTKPLGTVQLHKAQKQLVGQVALSQENNLSLSIALGKSMLNYGRIDTIEDVYAKISNVSAADILELSNTVFDPKELSLLQYNAR